MHKAAQKLPIKMEAPGTVFRAADGFGGMTAVYAELPKGADLAPLLEGLPGDACTCPHWGYVIRGRIRITNAKEGNETIEAGQMFYLAPGHVPRVTQDAAFIEFAPEPKFRRVLGHVLRRAKGR